MATDTAGDVGQQYPQNMVHYVAKTITYADDDLVVTVGKLPPRAAVIDCGLVVTTAFSGGSPVVDLGTSTDPDAYASALVATTAGTIRDVSSNPLIANDDWTTSATTVVASLTSGSTITAGSGIAFFTYILADR